MVPHPPYSPDFPPCDFFLFPRMKSQIKGVVSGCLKNSGTITDCPIHDSKMSVPAVAKTLDPLHKLRRVTAMTNNKYKHVYTL
jgi:hypothetical protein